MQEKEQEYSLFKRRILDYLAIEGIKPAEFYRKSGITRGVLTQPNGLSEDNLLKFFACFPEVNTDWIIKGIGDIKQDNSLMQEKEQELLTPQVNTHSEASLLQEITRLKEEKLKLMERIIDLQGRIIGK